MQTASEPLIDGQKAGEGKAPTLRGRVLLRAIGWLACLGLLAGYAAVLLAPIYSDLNNSDFAVTYYPAAKLLIAGGDPFAAISLMYKQPVMVLLPVMPLTAFPIETARAIWLALEVALLLAGAWLTVKALDFRLTNLRAAFTMLVYLSPNIAWGLMIGQLSLLIFFLQALGLFFLRSQRPFMAGLALGTIVLKPHLLLVELPLLLAAGRRAWAGAATSIAVLLLLPELAGVHLFESFVRRLILTVGEEKFNKLNPADMFVNLGGGPGWLRGLGWALLGAMAILYLALLWRVWRERSNRSDSWQLSATVQQAMLAAFMFLPYTLAYDIILVAGVYLWRLRANGYSLDRPLTWNIGLLWLLPIITLLLHARGVPTTLNPLLIIGLFFLTMPGKGLQPQSPQTGSGAQHKASAASLPAS